MSNTYCPFIDHQIMIDFEGKASACCQFEAYSLLKDYPAFIENYKQQMMAGEKIKPCRRCWEDEEKGFPSLRQSALTDFKRYSKHEGLMILDLRLTNNCNLACTMCSEHSSTLWAKLKKKNNQYLLDKDLQQELIANSANLVKLSIQGGEPFYGDDFTDFVELLPNKSNIQLEIFSNTITADIKMLKKWVTEFKQVSFISSVDGVEDVFEDIRWPAKWDRYQRKIFELYKIKQLGLSFNYTLQNLNILNIDKFISWRNHNAPRCGITISILEWPKHFQFTVLTEEENKQALELIKNITNVRSYEQTILDTIVKQLSTNKPNVELLEMKNKSLDNIKKMRENYLVRPERLELSRL